MLGAAPSLALLACKYPQDPGIWTVLWNVSLEQQIYNFALLMFKICWWVRKIWDGTHFCLTDAPILSWAGACPPCTAQEMAIANLVGEGRHWWGGQHPGSSGPTHWSDEHLEPVVSHKAAGRHSRVEREGKTGQAGGGRNGMLPSDPIPPPHASMGLLGSAPTIELVQI